MELEPFDWSWQHSSAADESPPPSPLSPESPMSPAANPIPSDQWQANTLELHASLPPLSQSPLVMVDNQGLSVTLSSSLSLTEAASVIDAINEYMHQVFTYGNSWHVIHAAVNIDPHCLLAQVLYADYLIAAERLTEAYTVLTRAKRALSDGASVSDRERLYIIAWNEWMRGKHHALATLHSLIDQFPNDLFAVKKAQLISFMQSDFGSMLNIVTRPAVVEACAKRPFYHGMLAFALEENHRISEAMDAALTGLRLSDNDVWSVHAIAHCHLHDGQLTEGIDWLSSHWHRFARCMSFMQTHAAFHYGLFLIELQQWQRLSSYYVDNIWKNDNAMEAQRVNFEQRVEKFAINPHNSNDRPFEPHDKRRTEDQLNALLVVWKWELRQSSAQSRTFASLAEFDCHYHDLIAAIGVTPPLHLGLFALCLIHALIRAQHTAAASDYIAGIEAKINTMAAKNPRRHLKHERIFLPLARAIYDCYSGGEDGARQAFEGVAPLMRAYHGYIRRQAKRVGEIVTDSQLPPVAIANNVPDANISSKQPRLHGRHVLKMIGGSGEQRSIITDWWIELLIANHQWSEARTECRSVVNDRHGRGCHHFESLIALCVRKVKDGSNTDGNS